MLPADVSYRDLDISLAREKRSHLPRLIAPLRKDFHLIVFDCPLTMSQLSEQIFRCSDLLLAELIPTTLSLRTLDHLRDFLKREWIRKVKLRTFLSIVDRRKTMHRAFLNDPAPVRKPGLGAAIPYSSTVERMGDERSPVVDFAPSSPAAAAFRALWDEVAPLLF